MRIYFQDLEYSHLLYNTFGPVTCSVHTTQCIKLQTNNGTGKTIFLKTLIGMLLPKKGILIAAMKKNIILSTRTNRLSNSQYKKFRLITSIKQRYNLWIFDEPYSFLDITSIIYYKKRIISHTNSGGSVLLTDCVKRTMLPCILYYNNVRWL